eukprot:m.776020 g.776020  ORF g.776020 m.776020 type:complete len:345 (-) comp23261_c0_seq6:2762-3796(-)
MASRSGSDEGEPTTPKNSTGKEAACNMGCSGSFHADPSQRDKQVFFHAYIKDGTRVLKERAHQNALRASPYQGGGPERQETVSSQVNWKVKHDGYYPEVYTAPAVLAGPVWADKADVSHVAFNAYDTGACIDRKSYEGDYPCTPENMPLNPRGRTGLAGRGLLGRYGPNHAADPVLTRWRRNEGGEREFNDIGEPILEFVAIKRKDTGDWAIPGGMVDAGENVSYTLKREFGEEAMDSMAMSQPERKKLMQELDKVFKDGIPVYKGYVDDIRNTDNAWMETTCVNFHDETGTVFSKFKLKSGDDAGDVAWTAYYPGIPLYATHNIFLDIVYKMRLAWFRHTSDR